MTRLGYMGMKLRYGKTVRNEGVYETILNTWRYNFQCDNLSLQDYREEVVKNCQKREN